MGNLFVDIHQTGKMPIDVRFSAAAGEVLALVGPSGAGKSTVLRAIAGLMRPESGQITIGDAKWFGEGVFLAPHKRRLGMVFQNYALFPHMSALQNVMAAGVDRSAAQKQLALVHLDGLEHRRPAELSGGQQQRVAVARALARRPEVLLLDEPFSAVDKATRLRLYAEISLLRQNFDMPVVLVTHDLDEAMLLADRMVVLHRGRSLQEGSPLELTTRPDSAEIARLVGVQNIFEARLKTNNAQSYLDWNGVMIELPPDSALVPNSTVKWVIPEGFVVLHRRDRPSNGERENPVSGTVKSVLHIGQNSRVVLVPDNDPEKVLRFGVPLHVARRNGLEAGVRAGVSLLSEGIHILKT